MDTLLATHLIDPQVLRSDDFEAFVAARKASLLGLVESAMGQSVRQDLVEDLDTAEEEEEEVA